MIKLYLQHEGDMDAITASALCCSQEDEPRLCSMIQDAIDSGEVTAFPAFTHETEKKKRARRKRVRDVGVESQLMCRVLFWFFAMIVRWPKVLVKL